MIVKYEYTVLLKDPRYFSELFYKRTGIRITVTSYPPLTRTIINSPKELTPEEKSILDSLVAENPVPVSTYELLPVTPDDIEIEIGVRPVILIIDPTTGTATCHFDTTLTPEQEAMLEALLRSPMKFKRVR